MTGALHTHILKEHRHIKEKPKGPGGNPSNGRVSAARGKQVSTFFPTCINDAAKFSIVG